MPTRILSIVQHIELAIWNLISGTFLTVTILELITGITGIAVGLSIVALNIAKYRQIRKQAKQDEKD